MKKQLAFLFLGTGILISCNPKSTKTGEKLPPPEASKGSKQSTISIDYMDKTIRPQDDFFQFANGTWCKNNPVPSTESRWGSFNELDQRNKVILKELLDNAASSKSSKGSQNQLLGDYYKAFTNIAKRNELGSKPLQTRLAVIRAIKSKDEIVGIIAEMHKKGINCLFGLGVGQDIKDPTKNVVYFGQGGIGLPNKDYYFKENKNSIRESYQLHIEKCFSMSGESGENAKKMAKNAFAIERLLAESMMEPAQMREPEKTYNKYTYEKFVKNLANFRIERYLKDVGCSSFDTIIVGQPDYLTRVDQAVMKANMQQWQDYLAWCTINHYAGLLDEGWMSLNFSFYGKVMKGTTEMKPIHERCIEEITHSTLGELLGKAYVEKSFSENAKIRVNKMVDNLLLAFKNRINNLDWMTPETKVQALNKLNAIGRKLGFPDEWKSYGGLSINADDYIGNFENCQAFAVQENFSKLNKPVNKKEWEMPAHLVNAYYHPMLNEIAFPAGIMQPPFFDENAEDAVNYGRIGMVIGHEFTHGFDDMGSKFAADGSFSNWWSDADRKSFEERTLILGNTFNKFCPFEDNCVNPELTMGENIADLGGLTMAYYAYAMTDDFKNNVVIDGYTPAQRFFIAYAQLWKINYTDAELKNRIATDSHSPGMYRVNGPLMNCPEFFQAFDVKLGDKMRNPDAQVSKIW